MYEYAIMSETVALELLTGKTKKELLNKLEMALIRVMDVVHKSLRTYEGGGWEILSHDLTKLEHHFLITFLIRRKK
jgi:hypothetical protein